MPIFYIIITVLRCLADRIAAPREDRRPKTETGDKSKTCRKQTDEGSAGGDVTGGGGGGDADGDTIV